MYDLPVGSADYFIADHTHRFCVCLLAGSPAQTIVICNAILNSEAMTDDQTDAMVDRLASLVKREA